MIHSDKLDREYDCLHAEVPDYVLFMQVGAFMRVMDDDAKTVAQVTGIKLSMSGSPARPRIIAGFPCVGLDKYVGCLVRAGYSLAIAEQREGQSRAVTSCIRLCPRNDDHGEV